MRNHRPMIRRALQRLSVGIAFAGLGALASGGAARAGKLTTVASFDYRNGAYPYGGLVAVKNTLYGTTMGVPDGVGSSYYGTLFSFDPSSHSLTTLASFNGSNGAYPTSDLVNVESTLYGTTSAGGSKDLGTLFSFDPSSGILTALASFNYGGGPGGLIDVNNALDGETNFGGGSAGGTLFSYDPSSGKLMTLARFTGSNGAHPSGGLVNANSMLYGTTSRGGSYGWNDGTLFSYNSSTGKLTTLVTFEGSDAYPSSGLLDVENTLYGTTDAGGSSNDGTLFSYDPSRGALSALASFNGSNGADPSGGLLNVDNMLYGTTRAGGSSNEGTLFSFEPSSGNLTVLASFSGNNGAEPMAGLIDVSNTLYGTTARGGSGGYGTIFAYQLPTSPTEVPEPGSLALFATGAAGLGLVMMRRRRPRALPL